MNEINKALRSINIPIIEMCLFKSLSDSDIFYELIDDIDLDLFNNNEDTFEYYLSLVTEIAQTTEAILEHNKHNPKE